MIKKEDYTKIRRDSDYIWSSKHDYSLRVFLTHYPNGAPDSVICRVLCISQEELDNIYKSAIIKIKAGLGENE